MILQNNVKRIITEVGKEFGLSPVESSDHYLQYINEFVLKSLYEADFDILRIEGLGIISPGLLRTKGFYKSIKDNPKVNPEIAPKLLQHINHMDELNLSLKKKRLYR